LIFEVEASASSQAAKRLPAAQIRAASSRTKDVLRNAERMRRSAAWRAKSHGEIVAHAL